MKKKSIIKVLAISFLFIALLSGCSSSKDGVVAIVNGEEISIDEYNREYEIYKALFVFQNGEEALYEKSSADKTYEDTLKRDIYDKLILEKIIEQDFNKAGLTITSQELEKYMEESLGEARDEFSDFISKIGISWEDVQKLQKSELMVNKHKDHYFETLNINEIEIKEYYNKHKDEIIKYRLSQIYLEDEQKANDILNRLKKGESFEELAKIESKDSISAIQGGDVGYIRKGQDPVLDDYIKGLKVGEITDVISASNGFFIMKLTDVKESFDDLKDDVVLEIKNNKYIEYVTELKNEAKIKNYYDNL